jgi:hypothetical protein
VEDDTQPSIFILCASVQPDNLENVVKNGLITAQWFFFDPVCIDSPGQSPDSCNLAACYGCALLPATSCEEGNRLLDRAMLTGTMEAPEIGFFRGFEETT